MEQVVDLIIPFIVLVIIGIMIDKVTQFLETIIHKIPNVPDKFEWYISYIIVVELALFVCYRMDFVLFDYLDIVFQHRWEGYVMTALIVSGGSKFLKEQFAMFEYIPSIVQGISTTRKKTSTELEKLNEGKEQETTVTEEINYDEIDEIVINKEE